MNQNKAADQALRTYCLSMKFYNELLAERKELTDKAWKKYLAIVGVSDKKTGVNLIFNIWDSNNNIELFYVFFREFVDSQLGITLKVLNETQ
ncbi:unnamed protein product [marine sediment metagenome]|uniref:Uncharacterized protein n=1 Tax=marine sediment metagenome TaxID=412755 RepID=X1ACJ6_9ZZZZ